MKKLSFLLVFVLVVNLFAFTIPTMTFAAEENVAVGKPTTGTTMYDASGNFHPEKATDGDYGTRWARGSIKVEGQTPNDLIKEWVQIDLERAYPVSRVVAHSLINDASCFNGYTVAWLSNDPTFSTNTSKRVTLTRGADTDVTATGIANFNPDETYRYVRVGRNSTAWISLCEIEVYADTAVYDPNAVSYSDIEGSEYEGAIKILQKLGINYAAKKDEYGVNLLMNRSTAVETIVKLFYEDPEKMAYGDMPFADIDESMSYYDSVLTAYNAGIIKGDLNGNFNPDLYVTVNEMAAMLLRALGYDEPIESYGSWEVGISRIGKIISLFDGISADKANYLSYGAAAQLMVNALAAPPYNKFGSGLTGGEKPIIETRYGMTVIEGIVSETNITSLEFTKTKADNQAVVGEVALTDSDGMLNNYIGYNIRACYDKNDNLVTAWAVDNDAVTFSVADTASFPSLDNNTYEVYDSNDNLDKYKLKDGFDVVYNGIGIFDFTVEDLEPENGGITVLDNNKDGFYDVVIINEYKAFELEVIASSDETTKIAGKDGKSYSVPTDKLSAFDETGAETEPSKIKTGSIVKLYVGDVNVLSEEKSIYTIDAVSKLEVVEAGASGTVTKKNGSDSVTVDGTSYDLAPSYGVSGTMNMGDSVELYFDDWDKVIYVKNAEGDTSWKIAFVIDARLMDSFTNDYSIKLYTEDGEFLTYDMADKIRLDGVTMKLDEFGEMLDNCANGVDGLKPINKEFIRFKLNSEGKLFEIDSINCNTEKEDPYDTITYYASDVIDGSSDQDLRYVSTADAFYSGNNFKFLAPANTTTFIIPTVNGEYTASESYSEYYSVNNKVTSAVPEKSQFTEKVKVYMKDEYGIPKFVVVNNNYEALSGNAVSTITTSSTDYMLIDDVNKVYYNNMEYYELSGCNPISKSSVSYMVDDVEYFAEVGLIFQEKTDWLKASNRTVEASYVNAATDEEKARYISHIGEIKRGDVIRYQVSGSYIRKLERIYEYEAGTVPVQTQDTWSAIGNNFPNFQYQPNRFQFATVNSIDAKIVTFGSISNEGYIEPYLKSYFGKLMFVSADGSKIELQSIDELANYMGDNYRALFYCQNGAPKSVIVYEYTK